MITIDFRKCAIFENYSRVIQGERWSGIKFNFFTAMMPYKGDWLVIDFEYNQIDWDNPVFSTEDMGYFLDYTNQHLIRFLPAELAKEFVNHSFHDQLHWRQSSFPLAKRKARRLQREEEERYAEMCKELCFGNEECNNWQC